MDIYGQAFVGGGKKPSGSITIRSNNTYDVTDYATAVVNVPAPTPTSYKVVLITTNTRTYPDITITINGGTWWSTSYTSNYLTTTVGVNGTITFTLDAYAYVYVNGARKVSGPNTYNYTVTKDTFIAISGTESEYTYANIGTY